MMPIEEFILEFIKLVGTVPPHLLIDACRARGYSGQVTRQALWELESKKQLDFTDDWQIILPKET